MDNNVRKNRFKGANWFNKAQETSIIIGGAGGIGSHLIFSLSRIGYELYVYDFDTVEEVNLGGQLYGPDQLNKNKVIAIKRVCKNLGCDINKITSFHKFDENSMVTNICIAGFDNMRARRLMFDKWYRHAESINWKDVLFIDGRLLAEIGVVISINSKEKADYYLKNDMFDDSKVEQPACTLKSTTYSAQIISGLITANLNNFICNTQEEGVREVPYKIEYNLPFLMFDLII